MPPLPDIGLETQTFERLLIQNQRSPGFLKKLFTLYITDGTQLQNKFQQAHEAGDQEAMRLHAHTLKSASLNVGLTRISNLARALEQNCIDGKETTPPFLALQQQWQVAIPKITAYLDTL
ncbi:Hpt domain-containing protein [Magnetococcus sp. PR-3]|uniref:Hpt domain-containing protein n=1 Tax=Magnetococcus sp. PR-3 TaxID=3120355 RepID=UPI002FCE3B1A